MIDLTLGIAFFLRGRGGQVSDSTKYMSLTLFHVYSADNCTVLLFTHVDTTVELALQLLLSS